MVQTIFLIRGLLDFKSPAVNHEIYEKLHVSSMTEAVAKAINQKLFSGE